MSVKLGRQQLCDVCEKEIKAGDTFGILLLGTRRYDPGYPEVSEWRIGEGWVPNDAR